MMSSILLSYADGLSVEAKSYCLDKMANIGGIDPFRSSTFGEHSNPSIDACDLMLYLVLQTSFITVEQFRVQKELEAYNQYTHTNTTHTRTRHIQKHTTHTNMCVLC